MDDFKYIDIILLALIAAFLVLRLRSVLGKRPESDDESTAFETPPRRWDTEAQETGTTILPDDPEVEIDGTLSGTLTRLRLIDKTFSPEDFLNGARSAFQMVLTAFANGDRGTLRGLLSQDVFANFDAAMKAREDAGETVESELISFKSVAFDDVDLTDDIARITVKFVTEQVNVLKDKDGSVIEGDSNQIETLTDVWTFSRDVTSKDPNWELVATHSPEE